MKDNFKSIFTEIHDCEVSYLKYDYLEFELILHVLNPSTMKTKKYTFEGVNKHHCSGALKQNVILDVYVFNKLEAVCNEIDIDYYNYCKKKLGIVNNNEFNLFYLEPSIGIEVACSFLGIIVE